MFAEPLPDFLLEFMEIINRSLNTKFNGMLINYYRDGSDSTGSHADNEHGLFNGMVVAFTLMNSGGTRKFRIRRFHGEPIEGKSFKDIITRHNQLLVMGGDFQKQFQASLGLDASGIGGNMRYHRKRVIRMQNESPLH